MSKKLQDYKNAAEVTIAARSKTLDFIKDKSFDTIATHGVYSLSEAIDNNGSIIEPIYMSSAQVFRDGNELEAALAYEIPSWSYTRIHNPSIYYLESTLALLEGYGSNFDTSCCVTSSGMAAITTVINALLADKPNTNFVSSSQIYGGSFQQFSVRQKEKNHKVIWVYPSAPVSQWAECIDENTRFIYVEVLSNPCLEIADIKALSELAHQHKIPLVVDSTLATPALIRPIQLGADIVIHSLSKIMTASGLSIGGAIIARKNIEAYYLDEDAVKDFAVYLKLFPNRDNGACLSPMQAAIILSEIRTIRMRVDQLSQNTEKIVTFLDSHPAVDNIYYPGYKNYPQFNLAQSLFKLVDSSSSINRYGNLVSFTVKGGLESAKKVISAFNLIFIATDLGRIKSVATIPAISTHQQQGEDGRDLAGIPSNLIRLCVGAENPNDIIDDLSGALDLVLK